MDYRRSVLSNGVPVLTCAAPAAYGARLRLAFRAGAAQEAPDEEGLAHLTEHMPFKGSVSRDAQAVARAVERRGAEIDAFTDHHETSYIATGPGGALADVVEVLGDILCRPRLDPTDLERERSVIIEELRTYEDEPATIAYQSALAGLWRGWPLARPVAGRRDSVARLTLDQVRAWMSGQYGADRLVVAAAGAVTHTDVVDLIRRHFGHLPPVGPPPPAPATASTDGPVARLQARESEQVAICLALPAPAETDPRLPALEALAMLLGGNDCSRLFMRLRDELGLVYGVDAAVEVGPTVSQLVIATECAPRSLVTVLREIESVLDQLMAAPPADDELADALMVLRARWLLPFDTPTSFADWLVMRELWHPVIASPQEVVRRFDTVTPADVHAAAQACLAPEHRHLGLVGPLARTWRPVGWRVEALTRPRGHRPR